MYDTTVVVADPPSARDVFTMADHSLAEWTQRVAAKPVEDLRPWWARRYWNSRSRRAGIDLPPG